MKYQEYNEALGLHFYPDNHKLNYELINRYYSVSTDFSKHTGNIPAVDYIYLQSIQGVSYYTPNNEDWGDIIALDHKNKLAINTTFYEMDDMAARNSDYNFTEFNGKLTPRFQQ